MASANGKCTDEAFITLATNDVYTRGALVLAESLKKHGTSRLLVVMVTPHVSPLARSALEQVYDSVRTVDVLDSEDAAHLALLKRPELGITFTKIHCWTFTEYKKCVFMDADMMVLQNIDELFDREELSAAPDSGWPDLFNSGLFVFRPSLETFGKLLSFAETEGSFDGGDQGLLNMYFNTWATGDISRHLSFLYNLHVSASYTYLPAFKKFGKDTKVVHFLGPVKPWHHVYNRVTGGVQQIAGPSQPGTQHLPQYLSEWWAIYNDRVQKFFTREQELGDQGPVESHVEESCLPPQESVEYFPDIFSDWDWKVFHTPPSVAPSYQIEPAPVPFSWELPFTFYKTAPDYVLPVPPNHVICQPQTPPHSMAFRSPEHHSKSQSPLYFSADYTPPPPRPPTPCNTTPQKLLHHFEPQSPRYPVETHAPPRPQISDNARPQTPPHHYEPQSPQHPFATHAPPYHYEPQSPQHPIETHTPPYHYEPQSPQRPFETHTPPYLEPQSPQHPFATHTPPNHEPQTPQHSFTTHTPSWPQTFQNASPQTAPQSPHYSVATYTPPQPQTSYNTRPQTPPHYEEPQSPRFVAIHTPPQPLNSYNASTQTPPYHSEPQSPPYPVITHTSPQLHTFCDASPQTTPRRAIYQSPPRHANFALPSSVAFQNLSSGDFKAPGLYDPRPVSPNNTPTRVRPQHTTPQSPILVPLWTKPTPNPSSPLPTKGFATENSVSHPMKVISPITSKETEMSELSSSPYRDFVLIPSVVLQAEAEKKATEAAALSEDEVQKQKVEHMREWERGNIDYMGRDSFANIKKALDLLM